MAYSTENFYKTFASVQKRTSYKICIITVNPEEILLRSNIKDLNETSKFVEAYEAVTHSHFKIISGSTRNRRWICDYCAASGTSKCPASISVFIKKINTQNKLKDAFLRRDPAHPAVIKINPLHNHPLKSPISVYKLLNKVNKDVKNCFYEYFKRGYYGASAKTFHEKCLQKANFFAFEDETMNPSLPVISILYKIWLKMDKSMQLLTERHSFNSGSSQAANKLKTAETIVKQSSQNFEHFIKYEGLMSELKKEPIEECSATENIACDNDTDIKSIVNIKQEIIDEDENYPLPIISSYGSVAAVSEDNPTLSLPSQQLVLTASDPGFTETTMQKVAAVVKVLQPSPSQVVVYDQLSNTYTVVKCLSVNSNLFYSANSYKPYLPSTLLPSKIALHKP